MTIRIFLSSKLSWLKRTKKPPSNPSDKIEDAEIVVDTRSKQVTVTTAAGNLVAAHLLTTEGPSYGRLGGNPLAFQVTLWAFVYGKMDFDMEFKTKEDARTVLEAFNTIRGENKLDPLPIPSLVCVVFYAKHYTSVFQLPTFVRHLQDPPPGPSSHNV